MEGWGFFSKRGHVRWHVTALWKTDEVKETTGKSKERFSRCTIKILESTLYLSMLLSKELSDEIWLLLLFINLSVSWFVFSQIKCFLWRTIPTVSVIVIQKEERRGCYRRGRGWGSKVRYFYYLLRVLSSFIFPAQSVVLLPPHPPAHPPFGSLFSISLYTNKVKLQRGLNHRGSST